MRHTRYVLKFTAPHPSTKPESGLVRLIRHTPPSFELLAWISQTMNFMNRQIHGHNHLRSKAATADLDATPSPPVPSPS